MLQHQDTDSLLNVKGEIMRNINFDMLVLSAAMIVIIFLSTRLDKKMDQELADMAPPKPSIVLARW